MKETNQAGDHVREQIRHGYTQIAEAGVFVGEGSAAVREELAGGSEPSDCCSGGSCCGPTTIGVDQLAEQIGYTSDELEALPGGANMGLSCGNPTAIAELREGEVVLDLGSGGGFDVFLAGPRVGSSGRAIGIDMTAEMVSKARANIDQYRNATGLDNVEFRLGEIEHLPVADAAVDVVISNCALNLSTDKAAAWSEIFRVLKPGGRVAISDIALLKELPASARSTVEDWVGCVAGAISVDAMHRLLTHHGFEDITLTPKPDYVRAMMDAGDPLYQKLAGLLDSGDPTKYITSLDVVAQRPA